MPSRLLNTLERKLGRYAIPNLTLVLIAGQVMFYLAIAGNPNLLKQMYFQPSLVIEQGEWWRAIVFVFIPPIANPIFFFFAMYLFWLMGTALDQQWGTLKYNIFILIAYLATIGAAFIAPDQVATNQYITGSVFLAFAFLFPDFTILLFFILPVKVKWLALITWGLYLLGFLNGGLQERMLIIAAVLNFLLFFGKDLFRSAKRHLIVNPQRAAESKQAASEPFHTCTRCGATDITHPEREFRYTPECICMTCLEQQKQAEEQNAGA